MLVTTGSIVGLIFGLAHAFYVFRVVTGGGSSTQGADYGRGIYYALWTFVLWILFGTYVLVLWIAGAVVFVLSKVFR